MEKTEEEALRRQFEEAFRQTIASPVSAAIARVALQMVIERKTEAEVRAELGEKNHPATRDLAEELRAKVEANHRRLGHNRVNVPKPDVKNKDIRDWKEAKLGLFYRPADSELTYTEWMTSHGQGKHWTIANAFERNLVVWEPCAIGYWFLAEIVTTCPRTKTRWNDLTASVSGISLLSLEEYVIVYWTQCDLIGLRIDVSTWCWLRTRFGSGAALCTYGSDAGICVDRRDASGLAVPYDVGGGRRREEVALKRAA